MKLTLSKIQSKLNEEILIDANYGNDGVKKFVFAPDYKEFRLIVDGNIVGTAILGNRVGKTKATLQDLIDRYNEL